jgi:hypothetical protein
MTWRCTAAADSSTSTSFNDASSRSLLLKLSSLYATADCLSYPAPVWSTQYRTVSSRRLLYLTAALVLGPITSVVMKF